MPSGMSSVKADHNTFLIAGIHRSQPVKYCHESVASSRNFFGLLAQKLFRRHSHIFRHLYIALAKHFSEPAYCPHTSADSVAVIKIFIRYTGEFGPRIGSSFQILFTFHHSGSVGSKRQARRSLSHTACSQSFYRFIIRSSHHRNSLWKSCPLRGFLCHISKNFPRHYQLKEHFLRHPCCLVAFWIVRPSPVIHIYRPAVLIICNRIFEFSCQTVRNVSRRSTDPSDIRIRMVIWL